MELIHNKNIINMRTAFISLSFLLAGSLMVPAIAHTPANKKKVATTTQKGKILLMKEYIDQLMAKMTLQEKIGQLNLMVGGDITTGGALNTQVGGDIAKGNMGGVFNIKGLDKIKALQDIAIKNSRLGIPFLHEVCFNYYRLIVRFSPSCNVIDYCTTMASADFSRQALLRFFRKSNYLGRP